MASKSSGALSDEARDEARDELRDIDPPVEI
jgi:hypothetical protein